MNPKKALRKIAPKRAIGLAEESYRKGRIGLSHVSYGLPTRKLVVIAVTGTNGKTSTCNFLNDTLRFLGYRTAMFTTAVIEMDGERSPNTNHTTVPMTKDLFRFLRTAKIMRVDYVILEVTSHALHQHKLWGVPIQIAVMTNISQDHLDYHGTMERYAAAKARLFSKYMRPVTCVLNRDDEWYDYFASKAVGRIVTYGKAKSSDVRLASIKTGADGLQMRMDTSSGSLLATSGVIGEFNAYNLAAVVCILEAIGTRVDKIRDALSHVSGVPGRMEMIRSTRGFTAVVDYAHAPDALEKALLALRAVTHGKVSIVFGATGDRDTSKRPMMGEVAAKHADKIYLTDDETYTENGDAIRAEVFAGIVNAGGRSKTVEVGDRRKAIKKALSEAKKDDMILISGIGHQNYRAMNEGNIPWQEVDVVREVLAELGE
jgi:UDP-N-acetylmuramoyl-L-alanyl-D-glutamate--2,6-diaminopimelate ligase